MLPAAHEEEKRRVWQTTATTHLDLAWLDGSTFDRTCDDANVRMK
jgi:hypothetical protein